MPEHALPAARIKAVLYCTDVSLVVATLCDRPPLI